MQSKRTPAWWWVRLKLLTGIGVTVLVGSRGLAWWTQSVTFAVGDRITLGPLGVAASVLGPIMALALAVVGLIWMLRIFRGQSDEPSPWRYRRYR